MTACSCPSTLVVGLLVSLTKCVCVCVCVCVFVRLGGMPQEPASPPGPEGWETKASEGRTVEALLTLSPSTCPSSQICSNVSIVRFEILDTYGPELTKESCTISLFSQSVKPDLPCSSGPRMALHQSYCKNTIRHMDFALQQVVVSSCFHCATLQCLSPLRQAVLLLPIIACQAV